MIYSLRRYLASFEKDIEAWLRKKSLNKTENSSNNMLNDSVDQMSDAASVSAFSHQSVDEDGQF